MDSKELAKKLDHTNIKPEATEADIRESCAEAKQYGFRGVCVNPEWTKVASEELKGTGVKTVVLIDPPMGQSSKEERIAVAKKAKKDGADDLDIVMNVVDLKYERYDKVLDDLKAICVLGDTKVIIGSGYLIDEEVVKASALAKQAGAICVKTATFKDPLEEREIDEKVRHLKLMREAAPGLLIKASGNIKNLAEVQKALAAGADIIGTSSSVGIIKELELRK
ncbi:MAG: deoxyribose-phosphate aldolase [Candidatus Paceibacterota bacterium]|jgi:deoxyribose-phosphate aldolase